MPEEIQRLRERIDAIDDQILLALAELDDEDELVDDTPPVTPRAEAYFS